MFSHDDENGGFPEQPNLAATAEVLVVLFIAMMFRVGVVGAMLHDAPPPVTDETKPPDAVHARVLVAGGDRLLLDGQPVTEEELVADLLERRSQSEGTALIRQTADADKSYFYNIRCNLRNAGLHFTEGPPAEEKR